MAHAPPIAHRKVSSSDDDFQTADEDSDAVPINEQNDEELSDSSDDEAPEEEGVDDAREQIQNKEGELAKLEKQQKQKLKEQRRIQDSMFREQKQAKKRRLDVPDVLPDTLLEDLAKEDDNRFSSSGKSGAKHITFKDDESEEDEEGYKDIDNADINKQLRKTKLKLLRQLNKKNKTIGGMNVRLLEKKKSKLPPAAAAGHSVTVRNKWLKRRSLQKKRKY